MSSCEGGKKDGTDRVKNHPKKPLLVSVFGVSFGGFLGVSGSGGGGASEEVEHALTEIHLSDNSPALGSYSTSVGTVYPLLSVSI